MTPSHKTLHNLYENKRMTTREIGKKYGVSKTQVVRWMKSYDMPRRVATDGLENRGVTPPTAGELEWLVHVEHKSYREIAAMFGTDFTAVPYWLKKHGIAHPTVWGTRRNGVVIEKFDVEDARRRYEAGESTAQIASSYGVSRTLICQWFRSAGIQLRRDGWNGGHRYECKDGHLARSVYEQRVDDWLHEHGIEHELEPAYPWDRRYLADFKVRDAYIEVWGVTDNDAYKNRRTMKIKRCEDAGLRLISINHWQFAKGRRFWRPLETLILQEPTAQLELPLPE